MVETVSAAGSGRRIGQTCVAIAVAITIMPTGRATPVTPSCALSNSDDVAFVTVSSAAVDVPGIGPGCLVGYTRRAGGPAGRYIHLAIVRGRRIVMALPKPPAYIWDSDVDSVCSAGFYAGSAKRYLVVVGETDTRQGLYYSTIVYQYEHRQFVVRKTASLANPPAADRCDAEAIATKLLH